MRLGLAPISQEPPMIYLKNRRDKDGSNNKRKVMGDLIEWIRESKKGRALLKFVEESPVKVGIGFKQLNTDHKSATSRFVTSGRMTAEYNFTDLGRDNDSCDIPQDLYQFGCPGDREVQ